MSRLDDDFAEKEGPTAYPGILWSENMVCRDNNRTDLCDSCSLGHFEGGQGLKGPGSRNAEPMNLPKDTPQPGI